MNQENKADAIEVNISAHEIIENDNNENDANKEEEVQNNSPVTEEIENNENNDIYVDNEDRYGEGTIKYIDNEIGNENDKEQFPDIDQVIEKESKKIDDNSIKISTDASISVLSNGKVLDNSLRLPEKVIDLGANPNDLTAIEHLETGERLQSENPLEQRIEKLERLEEGKEVIPQGNLEVLIPDIEGGESANYQIRWCNLICLCINIAIGYFMIGYQIGVFNAIQNNIAFDLSWTTEEKKVNVAVITVMIPVGAIFGSIVMGKISHQIGRKWSYIIYDFISIVGIAISMVADTWAMIIGRLITGFGTGGYVAVVPLLMKEFVPDKYEGYGASCYNFAFTIGLLTSFSLGQNISPATSLDLVWWRIMYAFPTILIILNFLLFFTVYKKESPVYLLSINERDACVESYKEVYLEHEDALKVVENLELHLKKKAEQEEYTYAIICSPRFSKQLFIGIVLNLGLQCTAMNVFNGYSQSIYLRSSDLETAKLFTTLQGVSRLCGNIVSIFLFGKVSKKKTILSGLSIIALCLLTVSILEFVGFPEPEKYIILVFYFTFGATVFVVLEIGPELLPDIGVGILGLLYWIANVVVVVILPFMVASSLDLKGSIMIYFCITAVIIVILGLFYKESHGKTLNEVEEIYKTWF